jgi:hypothetical protein
MSGIVCPDGHPSDSDDYCDVCGIPINATPAPGAAASSSVLQLDTLAPCPNCGAGNDPASLFCEDCGYDFTTGTLPVAPDPTPASSVPLPAPVAAPVASSGHVVEIWVDPDWFAAQPDRSNVSCPSPGLPTVVTIPATGALIGRTSTARAISPQIVIDDSGVSRRHAQLTTDGTRWFIEDLGSSNGTFVGAATDPLPTVPLVGSERRELPGDARIYLGAHTRLVVRAATDAEKSG